MTSRPTLDQINLVVGDMEPTLEFYRLLGLDIDQGAAGWPPGTGGRHARVSSADGLHLDLDNVEFARLWGHGGLASGRAVIGFSFPSSSAVDETYRALVAAGHEGRRPPHGAFFGAHYAIVVDPDGRDVGLMGPTDPEQGFTPDRNGLPAAP